MPLGDVATLGYGVSVVIQGRANKQVRGVDAAPVIAGVADHHPGWDWTSMALVGKAVRPGELVFAVLPRHRMGVSVLIGSAAPVPAPIIVRPIVC